MEKLTPEVQIILQKWKDKKGNLIMILHEIQNHYGYVPRELSLEISRILDVPLARIYEVITFYNYFKLGKPGKYRISVCMGTACYLKGASQILEEIKNILHIGEGQVSEDGLFQLDVVRCLGCCGLAPGDDDRRQGVRQGQEKRSDRHTLQVRKRRGLIAMDKADKRRAREKKRRAEKRGRQLDKGGHEHLRNSGRSG